MLTTSPSIFFSIWSFIHYHVKELSDFVNSRLDFVMPSKSQLQNIQVISPIIISSLGIKNGNKNDNYEPISNIELFEWKLRKNLETLTFLAELESRYDLNKSLPKFTHDYKAVKIEVQQNTVELTRKLTSYKKRKLNRTSTF